MAYDMTPVNYATGADSPLQAFTQGAKAGSDIQNSQLQQQQQEIAIQQQKNYMTGAQQVISNGSHPQDMANFMLANPSFADPIAKAASLMDTAQKQAALTQLTPTMAAIYSGNYDVAAANMDKAKEAYLASGDNEKAANAGMWADMIRKSPSTAKFMMAGTLAAAGGPQQFAENFTKFADDNRKQDLHAPAVKTAEADATIKTEEAGVSAQKAAGDAAKAIGEGKKAIAEGNAAPTMESLKAAGLSADMADKAAKLGLDQQKAADDTRLRMLDIQMKNPLINPPEGVRTEAGKAASTAATADQLADRVDGLADQFEGHTDWLTGGIGRGLSYFKEKLGVNTTYQQLMQQAALVRGPIVKNIIMAGGGIQRITDSDLKVFAAGVPDASAPPSQQISFLRGFAKAQRLESITNQAKADWVFQNSFAGRAMKDLNIMGITVPAGTNFSEFLQKNSAPLLKQELGKAATTSAKSSIYGPYMEPQSQAQP